jgi:hypothetical protein
MAPRGCTRNCQTGSNGEIGSAALHRHKGAFTVAGHRGHCGHLTQIGLSNSDLGGHIPRDNGHQGFGVGHRLVSLKCGLQEPVARVAVVATEPRSLGKLSVAESKASGTAYSRRFAPSIFFSI